MNVNWVSQPYALQWLPSRATDSAVTDKLKPVVIGSKGLYKSVTDICLILRSKSFIRFTYRDFLWMECLRIKMKCISFGFKRKRKLKMRTFYRTQTCFPLVKKFYKFTSKTAQKADQQRICEREQPAT